MQARPHQRGTTADESARDAGSARSSTTSSGTGRSGCCGASRRNIRTWRSSG